MNFPTSQRSLLDLLAEVRQRVYGFLFPRSTAIIKTDSHRNGGPRSHYAFIVPISKSSPRLWSSRAFLEEATPVLYNHTIFSMGETLDYRRRLFSETSKHIRKFQILASAQADDHRWKSIIHLNDSPLQYCRMMVVGAHWSHQNNLNPPTHDSDLGIYPEVQGGLETSIRAIGMFLHT